MENGMKTSLFIQEDISITMIHIINVKRYDDSREKNENERDSFSGVFQMAFVFSLFKKWCWRHCSQHSSFGWFPQYHFLWNPSLSSDSKQYGWLPLDSSLAYSPCKLPDGVCRCSRRWCVSDVMMSNGVRWKNSKRLSSTSARRDSDDDRHRKQ